MLSYLGIVLVAQVVVALALYSKRARRAADVDREQRRRVLVERGFEVEPRAEGGFFARGAIGGEPCTIAVELQPPIHDDDISRWTACVRVPWRFGDDGFLVQTHRITRPAGARATGDARFDEQYSFVPSSPTTPIPSLPARAVLAEMSRFLQVGQRDGYLDVILFEDPSARELEQMLALAAALVATDQPRPS